MNKTKLTPLQQDILNSLHPEKWSILDAEMNYLAAVELTQQGLAERHSQDLRKFRLGKLTPFQISVLKSCTYEDTVHIWVNKLGKKRKEEFLQLRENGLVETHPDQPHVHRRLVK